MTQRPPATGHLAHLDGLRGLAALQVVAQHYVFAFLPGLILVPPLGALIDGAFAVSLFFLLSGAVLTLSFARTAEDLTGNLARRLVRLWVPAVMAGAFAYLIIGALPAVHGQAAQLTGSGWLGAAKPPASVSLWLREVLVDSMPLGETDSSLFAHTLPGLRPLRDLFDPPLWSLHIELYGSLLVLGLTWLRARFPQWHRVVAPSLCVLLLPHPIALILLGHLTAPLLRPGARRMDRAATPLIAAGLLLIALPPLPVWQSLDEVLVRATLVELAPMYCAFTLQCMLGAVLVYAGVLMGVRVQRALAGPVPRWLGRLSFSLYLIHFPILLTLTSLGLVIVNAWLPFSLAAVMAVIAGLGLTVAAALLFERWVDRPAIALSRKIAGARLAVPMADRTVLSRVR